MAPAKKRQKRTAGTTQLQAKGESQDTANNK